MPKDIVQVGPLQRGRINHTIIIDAKFYKKALAQSPYGERLRSQHLYQLITYLEHERVRHTNKDLVGMLIYPDVGRSLRLRYRLLGIPVLVATVNLGQEWRDIEAELHGLLDDCASAAGHGQPRIINVFAGSSELSVPLSPAAPD